MPRIYTILWKLLCAMPVISFLFILSYWTVIFIDYGYRPTYGNPDAGVIEDFPILHSIAMLATINTLVSPLLALLGWVAIDSVKAISRKYLLFNFVSWIAWWVWLFNDPYGIQEWFLD